MRETLESASCETAPGNRGHFMRTYSGRQFWPMDPRAEDMCIEDVAHHLSMQVRFNGATKDFYSVAEHCVIGSHLVLPEHAFEFLMHDAAEAWLGDLIRPMKNHSVLGYEYKRVESVVESKVKQRWGLRNVTPVEVKRIDQAMCAIELQQVFLHPPDGDLSVWRDIVASDCVPLQFWPWQEAERRFLARFYELAPKGVTL